MKSVATLVGLLSAMLLGQPVWAHAFLDHAVPAVGSTVASAPSQVLMFFTQDLEPGFTGATIADVSGQPIATAFAAVDPQNKSELVLDLPKLAPGHYKVSWLALSVDTRRTEDISDFDSRRGAGARPRHPRRCSGARHLAAGDERHVITQLACGLDELPLGSAAMARKPVVSTALINLMQERHHHAWTLEDLHAGLAARDITADFSSVFRAAEKLFASGAIRKLTLDDGRARFELIDGHHDHLHCTRCGELVPIPCPIGPANFAALEREAGIAILDHHLLLSGVCCDCHEPSDPETAS